MDEKRPPRPLTPAEKDRVLDVAWKLQEQKEARDKGAADMRLLAEAGQELGLDPAHVKAAEARVRVESEESARRIVRSKEIRRRVVFSAVVITVTAVLVYLLVPKTMRFAGGGAAAPIVAPFIANDWRLETSPGTTATLRFDGDVATATVEKFTVMADGRYWANVESDNHTQWAGLCTVTFSVRGEGLPNVRLYLENPTERWRGPSIPVTSTWQTHALPLSAFEHQRKEGGWKVTADSAPDRIKTVSVKLGWYVNDAASHGTVELKDLHAE